MAVGSYVSNSTGLALAEEWSGGSWNIVSTADPSSTADLLSVSCAASDACMAVGDNGDEGGTLAERWNGTSWSVLRTPDVVKSQDDDELEGVSCTSATNCTAVGLYQPGGDIAEQATLSEIWDGTKKWRIQMTPDHKVPIGMKDFGYPFANYFDSVSCGTFGCTAVGAYVLSITSQSLIAAKP
jgi:hypothetical protein